MAKCFKFGLAKHREARCIGTRQLLTEEDERPARKRRK